MPHSRRQIVAAAFDGYQPKPIEIKTFLEAVHQMLDWPAGCAGAS
jgi:hypothetical protein